MSASLKDELDFRTCLFSGYRVLDRGQAPKRVWTNIRVARTPTRRAVHVRTPIRRRRASACSSDGRAARSARASASPSIVGRFPVTIPEMLSRADLVPDP